MMLKAGCMVIEPAFNKLKLHHKNKLLFLEFGVQSLEFGRIAP